MTTTVIVKAGGQHDVRLWKSRPGKGALATEDVVEAGTERTFHIWDDLTLAIQEIPVSVK